MAKPAPAADTFVLSDENEVLWPMSGLGARAWAERSVEEIREVLREKPGVRFRQTESEGVRSVEGV